MSEEEAAKPTTESTNTEPPAHPKKGGSKLQWGLLIVVVGFVAVGLTIPLFNTVSKKSKMIESESNARQIVIALKTYVSEQNVLYPDGKTSNDAFRVLFKWRLFEDERAFTAMVSPYKGDNDIGVPPTFAKALEAGENHWAMTRGLAEGDSGNAPLIFENPAVASWPPRWNADVAGKIEPGRTWKGGKIVIGRNDGSVAGEPLEGTTGMVTLKRNADGKNLFEAIGPHEVIDIARPEK